MYALKASPILNGFRIGCFMAFGALLALAAPGTQAAAPVTDGLQIHWPLDETSGLTAADASGNGHDGSLGNYAGDDSQWIDGQTGGALSFVRENSEFVEVSGLPEMNSTTWAAWVNLNSDPAFDGVISATFEGAAAGHSLGFHTDGTARHPRIVWNHNVDNTIIVSPDPIPLNEWHHIALTYDSAAQTLKLFVDGDEVVSDDSAASTPFTSINLGRREATEANYLDGAVDEVTIYDRALTDTEIKQLAGQVVTGPPVFTQQPQPVSIFEGQSASFSVQVEGQSPFSFQWQKDGADLSGATEQTLTLENVTSDQAGDYRVVVTNSEGEATSDPAALEVTATSDFTVGLQAHWKFDETTGLTASDDTGNGHTGDLMNFAGDDSQWVEGMEGGGIQFNGANFVQVPDAPGIGSDLADGMTVSAWFKSDVFLSAAGGGNRMLEKGNSYFFLQGVADGGMNFLVKNNGGNITAGIGQSLEADQWYHITGTFDGTDIRVYLDGELVDTVNVGGPIDTPGDPLVIGADDSGSSFFTGVMDEVMIWNRALSDSEVLNIIGRDLPNPPSLIRQPVSVEKYAGSTAVFSVEARGQEPFRYLWFKGDEEIRSATEPSLVITNIQPADAGEYHVEVSNDLGEIESDTVTLSVLPVEDLSTALRAQWKFDESGGLTAADSSGNGNDGELLNFADDSSHWVDGQVGGALRFNVESGVVTSNLVSVPDSDSFDLGTEPTFAFWLNPNSYGTEMDAGSFTFNEGQILRKGGYFDLFAVDNPGGVRQTLIANGVNAPPTSLQLDSWQHFAAVYRNGMIQFYKDGFPIGEASPGELGDINDLNVVLGNFDETGETPQYFSGDMDEVGIWARPLSEEEILELAGKDISGPPAFEVQPVEPLPKLEGGSVEFAVNVTGQRPVSYQWFLNGEPIPDATSNRLVLSEVSVADAGTYTVEVTNDQGSSTSDPVELVVNAITDVTSGLIAYWNFDETSGSTLTDQSGNGHDGELQNFTAADVTGQIDGAFDFDGVDDFVVVPHDEQLNLTDRGTISAWISPRAYAVAGGHARVVRKSINYDLSVIDAGNTLRFFDGQKVSFDAPADSVDLDVWQHVALVIKDGTVQFFKNGQPLAEPLEGIQMLTDSNPLVIGNFEPNLDINRLFDGLMDDLGIWNRALSAEEIDGIYQNGLLGKPLTAEFEPLNIRSLALPTFDRVELRFFTPFPEREYAVETKETLDQADWTEQTDVQFTDQGEGVFLASFPAPETAPTSFYRVVAMPPPALFADDFEAGGAGWTHGGNADTWELGTPSQGPGAAHSGVNVFATGLDTNFEAFSDAYLRSPEIDLTGENAVTLTFWEYRNIDPDITFHQAIVSVLDADTMQVIQELTRDAGATADWQQRTLRLGPDTLGRRVILEFRLVTDQFGLSEGWFIDDVMLLPE